LTATVPPARLPEPSPAPLPGWYGKLPSLGDFAGRRLPPLFVEPWDDWLAASLASWRASDVAWLDAYLAAPPLRFALGAGVPFEQSPGYAGVLMPSVDRVGRYFPLTVVRPRAPQQPEAPAVWLAALESVAIAALNEDWPAERFDDELGRLDDAAQTLPMGLTATTAEPGLAWPARGRALWWCDRQGELSTPVTSTGLPEATILVQLFVGRW
jgi:type VI secretion system ImpM family protein